MVAERFSSIRRSRQHIMDKTKQYRELCSTAEDLQELKWKNGFHEGDWVYFGKDYGTRTVGSDLFQVRSNADEGRFEFFKFSDADRIVFKPDTNHTRDLTALTGNYSIETFVYPIWLPRQDQLESFYYQKIAGKLDIKGWLKNLREYHESILSNAKMEFTPRSNEQLALAYVMNTYFKKVWDRAQGWHTP